MALYNGLILDIEYMMEYLAGVSLYDVFSYSFSLLVHFSGLVLSDECDESDELLVTVISILCCVCTRL